jgi:hypothetical protein
MEGAMRKLSSLLIGAVVLGSLGSVAQANSIYTFEPGTLVFAKEGSLELNDYRPMGRITHVSISTGVNAKDQDFYAVSVKANNTSTCRVYFKTLPEASAFERDLRDPKATLTCYDGQDWNVKNGIGAYGDSIVDPSSFNVDFER